MVLTTYLLGPVLAGFPLAALGGVVVYAAIRLVDVAELRRLSLSGERGGQWLLSVAGLVSLAAVVVVSAEKAKSLGVSVDEVYAALQTAFGSLYVNDFNRDGRTYQVIMQAVGEARDRIEDLRIAVSEAAAATWKPPLARLGVVPPLIVIRKECVGRRADALNVALNALERIVQEDHPGQHYLVDIARAALAEVGHTTAEVGQETKEGTPT